MTNSDLLSKLIIGCKQNDRKSQKQIYEKYYEVLFPICLRYSKNKEDAQDLLHECFIKIFDKISKYKDDGSFEGWMKRLVTNTSIDVFRKKSKSKEVYAGDYIENLDVEQDEVTENWFQINEVAPKVLMEEIQNLSPAYRTVFNMYVIEGYRHQEIAEYLNISVGSSKSNLSKAKAKLRGVLEAMVKVKKGV